MVLEPIAAADFIHGYSKVMKAIHDLSMGKAQRPLIEIIVAARGQYSADRTLLDKALAKLKTGATTITPEVLSAIRSMDVRKWVYLKDTKAYSVFINPDESAAYAVLGLTDRIRDIAGASGVVLETGIVKYRGRYVCDGIVANPVFLGPGYRKDFNAALARIKRQGNLHARCGPG